MKDNLYYYDEDSEDTSISLEAVGIPEIIADLQHGKTGEDLAAVLDITPNSIPTPPAISYTEALTCISTLIPYLETLPCSSLQQPPSRQSLDISDTVGYLQNPSSSIQAHQHKQKTLHEWLNPNQAKRAKKVDTMLGETRVDTCN